MVSAGMVDIKTPTNSLSVLRIVKFEVFRVYMKFLAIYSISVSSMALVKATFLCQGERLYLSSLQGCLHFEEKIQWRRCLSGQCSVIFMGCLCKDCFMKQT